MKAASSHSLIEPHRLGTCEAWVWGEAPDESRSPHACPEAQQHPQETSRYPLHPPTPPPWEELSPQKQQTERLAASFLDDPVNTYTHKSSLAALIQRGCKSPKELRLSTEPHPHPTAPRNEERLAWLWGQSPQ